MRKVSKFYLVLHPRPAYIVGSGRVGEAVNFMAASWVSPVAEEPPLVGVAVDVTSYTHELIERYGEFTVNVVPTSMLEKLFYVGSTSGRSEDKSRALAHRKGEAVSAPVVEGAVGVLECVVVDRLRAKDVTLFAGEVKIAAVDERFFSERTGWNFRELDLPLHNWGRVFYGVGRYYRV